MTKTIKVSSDVPVKGDYDIIVAGGGVAGIAAAVNASRLGKKTLLIEKTISLGGLATIGLINLFVPMCNGRGTKIIKGMAEEFLNLSIKYGYDTLPDVWKNGEPGPIKDVPRWHTRFSPEIFALTLTEYTKNENVDVLFDSVLTKAVTDGKTVKGVVVENKSGSEYYSAKMFVDTTGDCDLLYRAGVPTVQGRNFHTFLSIYLKLDMLQAAIENKNMAKLFSYRAGGNANLHGNNHPEGKPYWLGTNGRDVTNYVIENHIQLLASLKNEDRNVRDILRLPSMVQLRTTRHIDSDVIFSADDAYKHVSDSICAICDFERRDYLYEVSYRTLINSSFPNVITAGRSAGAEGYGWDVLRVIPPAILTGQAAGAACSIAIDDALELSQIDIKKLQTLLEKQNVMLHFDDALIPEKPSDEPEEDIGHI